MPNSNALLLRAPKLLDLLNGIAAFADSVFKDSPISVEVHTNVKGVRLGMNSNGGALAQDPTFLSFMRNWGDRAHVVCINANLTNRNNNDLRLSYECADGIVGEFTLNMTGDPRRAPAALESLEKSFALTNWQDLARTSGTVVDQAAIALRERSVADLQEIMRQQSEFLTKLAEREVENRTRLEAEQNAAFTKRTDALEKEYRDRQASLDQRKEHMEAEDIRRTKEFGDRVAQFEMREAKAMRRENEKRLGVQLTSMESMKLSDPTGSKRWWIHVSAWAMLATSGVLAGVMVCKVYSLQSFDWHYLLPLSGGFLAFVGTMVYYMKWNDRWFREHADGELAAKRYKADILRASWIAELVAEWAKEGKGELPPGLIDAYTRNLFRGVTSSNVSEHPMDDLTRLMKNAKRIDLGKKGISIRGGTGGAASD